MMNDECARNWKTDEAEHLFATFLLEIDESRWEPWQGHGTPLDGRHAKRILTADPVVRGHVVCLAFEQLCEAHSWSFSRYRRAHAVMRLIDSLQTEALVYDMDALQTTLHALAMAAGYNRIPLLLPVGAFLRDLDRYSRTHGLNSDMITNLTRLQHWSRSNPSSTHRELTTPIDTILKRAA
jgi:hypothetical protein